MPDIEKKTILVVDDAEINRSILSSILEDKYRIIEADNGLKAYRALEDAGGRVALILLDIVMPVADGFAFLKLLQKKPQYTSIPIIFVTSETYQKNIMEGLRMGVRDVIAKPFDPDELSIRVDKLIALTERRARGMASPRPRAQAKQQHAQTAQTAQPAQTAQTAQTARHAQPLAAPLRFAPSRRAILIADDDPSNRAVLRSALEVSYDILEAGDGIEALAYLEQYRGVVTALLLDVVLPQMDGFQLMQEAQNRGLLENVPVMAITADDSLAKRGRMMAMGVHEIIRKPFVPDVVQARVEHLVELYAE